MNTVHEFPANVHQFRSPFASGHEETSHRWICDPARLCLVLGNPETGAWSYEVDLEDCTTSAQALDWIMQVASKTWATDAVIAGLVRAIRDVLNPQSTLCSFGKERGPLDVRARLTPSPVQGVEAAKPREPRPIPAKTRRTAR